MVHEILVSLSVELCKKAAKRAWSYRKRFSPKPVPGIITYYKELAEKSQPTQTT
jgi:hypothetical protein